MEPWEIAIIVVIALFGIYIAFGLIVLYKAYGQVFSQRGFDPSNPCFLNYADYENEMIRIPFKTGYYGKAIKGYIYQDKGMNDFKGFVILSHGLFGTHIQYLLDISMLTKAGYRVLAYDQYGVGISEGNNQESLATGIYVLENVICGVEKNQINDNLPIYLYGHSWGAYCVAGALKKHKEIKGAVCLSAPFSSAKAISSLMSIEKPNLAKFLKPIIPLCSWMLLGNRYSLKANRGLKSNKNTPTLLIQAKDDTMVPYKQSLVKYYEKHPQKNATVLIRDKGQHNVLLEEGCVDKYRSLVNEFQTIDREPDPHKRNAAMSVFMEKLDKKNIYRYNTEVENAILNFFEENN